MNKKLKTFRPDILPSFIGIIIVSLLTTGFMFYYSPGSLRIFLSLLKQQPVLFFLNYLPVILSMLIIYFVTGNSFLGATFPAGISGSGRSKRPCCFYGSKISSQKFWSVLCKARHNDCCCVLYNMYNRNYIYLQGQKTYMEKTAYRCGSNNRHNRPSLLHYIYKHRALWQLYGWRKPVFQGKSVCLKGLYLQLFIWYWKS